MTDSLLRASAARSFAEAFQPSRRQSVLGHSRRNGATRFTAVAAIAKPALRRQRHDVVEGGGNARGGIVELQLAQPRGIGEPAATGQRQKDALDGGVAALRVVVPN